MINKEFEGRIYTVDDMDEVFVNLLYQSVFYKLKAVKSGITWVNGKRVRAYVVFPGGISKICG